MGCDEGLLRGRCVWESGRSWSCCLVRAGTKTGPDAATAANGVEALHNQVGNYCTRKARGKKKNVGPISIYLLGTLNVKLRGFALTRNVASSKEHNHHERPSFSTSILRFSHLDVKLSKWSPHTKSALACTYSYRSELMRPEQRRPSIYILL